MEEHIVIIGNGISGITCARHIRKNSNKKITVISGETEYFFSRTALMYVYMGHQKFEHTQPYENWFWKKNRINLIKQYVSEVQTDTNTLIFQNGDTLSYDKLVIATGSKPNKFGWPGQDLDGVMGMYHKQDLENIEKYSENCKRAVIVGGGLIGIEMAEMLRSRNIPVTFLVRENSFWNGVLPMEESAMINRHILEHHIDLHLGYNLKEIRAGENGKVKSIVITETEEEVACSLVGLTAGVSPNINFIKTSKIETNRGVLVDRNLQTNIKNIYAIGDCAEQHQAIGSRRNIEAVWYTGRMMGETLAQTLCGNEKQYKPGNWFNSAKFLDIEYQTYGWVWAKPKPEETHFYWEHKSGKKSIRLVYNTQTNVFLGMNVFGVRMRHAVVDKWLTKQKDIYEVVSLLKDANFDPEFYTQYEAEIVAKFNQENNTNIQVQKRNWKRILNLSK